MQRIIIGTAVLALVLAPGDALAEDDTVHGGWSSQPWLRTPGGMPLMPDGPRQG
jgi:hypothetical protein